MSIPDLIRERCSWVAGRATQVRVVAERIDDYAAEITESAAVSASKAEQVADADGAAPCTRGGREICAARWLTLDAINFGSGWFPTLRKRDEPTGYRTIAAGIARRFDGPGPWSAQALTEIEAPELAQLFGQNEVHPLMALFAESLRDLGEHLLDGYDGSFTTVVDQAHGSAVALLETLAPWRCFADVSTYAGEAIPFYKRAQIAAADLHRAGAATFDDLGQLTLFADNLVPHVLRLDGVLWFEPELVVRIEAGELIEHGSPEEVEIRACAVAAVERLVAAAARHGGTVTAAELDQYLWNRGQSSRYKSVPRHRSRCTAY